jgi:hypothetical protein
MSCEPSALAARYRLAAFAEAGHEYRPGSICRCGIIRVDVGAGERPGRIPGSPPRPMAVKLLAAPVRRAAQLSRSRLPALRNTLSGTTSWEPTSPSTPVSVTLELAATTLSGEITVTSPNSCARPLPASGWPEPVSEVTRLQAAGRQREPRTAGSRLPASTRRP